LKYNIIKDKVKLRNREEIEAVLFWFSIDIGDLE